MNIRPLHIAILPGTSVLKMGATLVWVSKARMMPPGTRSAPIKLWAAVTNPSDYTGRAAEQVEEFFGEEVAPWIDKYRTEDAPSWEVRV